MRRQIKLYAKEIFAASWGFFAKGARERHCRQSVVKISESKVASARSSRSAVGRQGKIHPTLGNIILPGSVIFNGCHLLLNPKREEVRKDVDGDGK